MGAENNHMNDSELDVSWSETLGLAYAARNAGSETEGGQKGWSKYIEILKDKGVEMPFSKHTDCLCCMDERVVFGNEKLDALYVAGSGILIKDDKEKRANFIAMLKNNGVKKIYSHAKCGAVGAYVENRLKNGATKEKAEKEVEDWYVELAEAIGGVYVKELPVTPENFHDAQVIYVDMIGGFQPGHDPKNFARGFVTSAILEEEKGEFDRVVSTEDIYVQVDFAINIALGDHSFGDRFDKTNPFTIVLVASSRSKLESAKKRFVDKFKKGNVVIDGFVA